MFLIYSYILVKYAINENLLRDNIILWLLFDLMLYIKSIILIYVLYNVYNML